MNSSICDTIVDLSTKTFQEFVADQALLNAGEKFPDNILLIRNEYNEPAGPKDYESAQKGEDYAMTVKEAKFMELYELDFPALIRTGFEKSINFRKHLTLLTRSSNFKHFKFLPMILPKDN